MARKSVSGMNVNKVLAKMHIKKSKTDEEKLKIALNDNKFDNVKGKINASSF